MTREEKEAYEWYKDRLSMPIRFKELSQEECAAYNEKYSLPSEEEIQKILKESEYYITSQ